MNSAVHSHKDCSMRFILYFHGRPIQSGRPGKYSTTQQLIREACSYKWIHHCLCQI